MHVITRNFIFLTTFFWSLFSLAAPGGFTYQGQIIDPYGHAVEGINVSFTLQVLSPGGEECLLYEEKHILNMQNSNGIFEIEVGTGTRSGSDYEDTNPLITAMSNSTGPVSPTTCVAGPTYTPTTSDSRRLRVFVDEGSGPVAVQDHIVRSAPFAMSASSLDGLTAADILQVNTTAPQVLSQANLEWVFETSRYAELQALINGTSTQYATGTPTGDVDMNGQKVINVNTPTAGTDAANKNYVDQNIAGLDVNAGVSGIGLAEDGQVLTWDGTAGEWIVQAPAAAPVDSVFGRTGAVTAQASDYDANQVDNTPYSDIAATDVQAAINELQDEKVSKAGDNMSGNLQLDDENELRLEDTTNNRYVGFKAPTTVSAASSFVWTLPGDDGAPNEVLQTNGSGVLQWVALPVGDVTGAANVGAGAGQIFRDESSGTLNLKTIAAGSASVTVTNNANDVSLDIADGGVDTTELADDAVTAAKLADTAVTPGSYGAGALIPTFTVDQQGRLTAAGTTALVESDPKLQTLTAAEVDQLENLDSVTISNAQWGYLGAMAGQPLEAVDGAALDNVWSSTGILVRTGANTYSTITDSSSNWDTAFGWGDHSGAGYALLAGQSGGQTLNGGTDASDNLILDSTANAAKGYVILQPTGGEVGIGDATPDHTLDVEGNIGIIANGYLNFGDTDSAAGYGLRDNGGTIEYKDNAGAWTSFASAAGDITSVNTNSGSGLSGGVTTGDATLQVVVDDSTVEIATNTIQVKDDGITSAKINDGTIATIDIADDAVTSAKLADTAVTAGAYGSASLAATFTVDAQGRLTAAGTTAIDPGLQTLTSAEVDQLENIDTVTISNTQWGYLGAMTGQPLESETQSLDDAYDNGSSVTVDSTDVVWNLSSTNDFIVQDNGTAAFTIDDSGNVGVGPVSPAYNFDMRQTTGVNMHLSGSGADTGSFLNVNAGSIVRWGANASYDTGSWVSKSITNQSIIEMGSSNFTIYHDNNGSVGGYAPSARLSIDSSGNVGIGDITPNHKFDVEGNIGIVADGYLNFGDTDGSAGYGLRDNSGVIEYKDSAGSWTTFASASGDITAVNTNSGSGLSGGATTGDATLQVVVDDSTVEIATNTIQVKDGGITSAKINDGTIATVDIADDAVTAAKLADTTVSAGSYGSATQVATFTVDAQGRLTAAGNTTITESDPKMQTLSSGEVDQLENIDTVTISNTQWGYLGAMTGQPLESETQSLDDAYNNGSSIDVDTSDVIWNLTGTNDFIVQDNGTLSFIVDDSGRVGIGTSSPSGMLHAYGSTPMYIDRVAANASHLAIRSANGSVGSETAILNADEIGQISFGGYDGGTWIDNDTGIKALATENWTGLANSGSKLLFKTKENGIAGMALTRMTIVDSGEVGIGVAVPNHLLDVNGNIGVATGGYINFDSNDGATGYGLRDNAGTIEFKDSGGSWSSFASAAGDITAVNTNSGSGLSGGASSGDATLQVVVDDSTVEIATNTIQVKDDGITSAKINDGTIATVDIADDAVTAAKLADTAVTAGTYGSASLAATFTVDAQGRLTAAGTTAIDPGLQTLTAAEVDQLENIDAVTISNTQWGYLGAMSGQPLESESQSLDDAYDNGSSVTVDSTDVIWNLTGTNDFIIQDNGTTTFVVNDSGNVGIGTTAPGTDVPGGVGALLHINGADSGIDDATLVIEQNIGTAPTVNPSMWAMRSRGTRGAKAIVANDDSILNLVGAGFDGTNYVNVARIDVEVDGTPGAGDMPGRLVFKTTNDGAASSTEKMRIDSSGNVGIGTSTPDHKLDVEGNIGIYADGYLNFGDTDGVTGYGIRDNSGVIEYKDAAGSWTTFASSAGDITAVNTNSGSGLSGGATTGDATLQVVVDDSTVEIATNTIQVKDDGITSAKINDGTIATVDIADDAVTAAKLADTAVTAGTYGSASLAATFTVDAQGRLTAAGTTAIDPGLQTLTSGEVDQLENIDTVTISNTQWGYLGAMSGQPLESETQSLDDAYDNGSSVTVDSTDVIWNLSSTQDFRIQDNGTDAFVVTDNGFVGIGTSSPITPLHVSQSSPQIRLQDSDNTTAQNGLSGIISLRDSAGTEYGWIGDGSGSSNDLTLYSGIGDTTLSTVGGELRLSATGDVGIGTATPNHLLDVEGNLGVNAGGYMHFGDTDGSTGYGFRDNAGTIEYKNSGGSWSAFASGTGDITSVNTNSGSGLSGGTSSGDATLQVVVDDSTVEIATNTIQVKDGGITSAKINDGTIATVDIADDAVTAAKLADTAVTAGTYGSASLAATFTVDAQGRLTAAGTTAIDPGLQTLTAAEVDQLENIDTVTISNAQWGYLGAMTGQPLESETQSLDDAYDNGSSVTVDSTDVIWNLSSTNDFIVQDNGTTSFIVDDSGNVGIGTSNPGGDRLKIESSGGDLVNLYSGSAGGTELEISNARVGNESSGRLKFFRWRAGSPIIANDIISEVRSDARHDTTQTDTFSSVMTTATAVGTGVESGRYSIQVAESGTLSSRLVIDGSNVGVGTETPNHLFDVEGNLGVNAGGYMHFGDTDGTTGYGFRDNAGTIEYKNSGGSWSAFTSGTGDITSVNTNSGSGLSGGVTSGDATLQVVVDDSTVEIATNTIQVKDDGITSAKINDGTIASVDIADDAVTAAKLADTAVTAGSYGSASLAATFTVDAQGRLTAAGTTAIDPGLQTLTAAEVDQLENIDTVTISNTQWGYLGAMTGQPLESETQSLNDAYDNGSSVTVDSTDVIWNLSSIQDFRIQDNGTDAFVVSDSGYTGIGTSNPDAPLTVVGANLIGAQFIVTSPTTAGQGYGARIIAGTNSSDYNLRLDDATNSNSYMVVRGDGYVGIGTVTPNHLFDVEGSLGVNAGSYIHFGDTDGATGYGFRDNAGTIEYKNSGGSWSAFASGTGDITSVLTNSGSGLSGGATVGDATLQVVVDDSTVEIATNTIQVKDGGITSAKINDGTVATVDIADDAVTADKLANTTVTAGTYGSASLAATFTVDDQGRLTAAGTTAIDPGLQTLTAAEVDQLENIDTVTISNSQWGYLGGLAGAPITSESQSLDDAYDNGSSVTVDSTDVVWNLTGTNDFIVQDNGSTSFIIDDSGNVGIGTTSPNAHFEVYGLGSSNGAVRTSDSGDSDFTFIDPNYGLTLNRTTGYISNSLVGGALRFRTSNAASYDVDAMHITASGNVGVGTISPNHLLDVEGNLGVNAGGYMHFGDTDGATGYGFRDNAGTIEYKNSGGSWSAFASGTGDITSVNTNSGSGLSGGTTSGDATLQVVVDDSTVEIATNTIQVKDSGITSAKINDGTIATVDIADDAVTAAKLADTAVTAGTYGSASLAATFTVDAQGRLTAAGTTAIDPGLQTLTAAEVDQLENIDAVTISNAQWGYLGGLSGAPITSESQSLDDAYDNGSSVTVDSTDVVWNLTSTNDFIVQDNGVTAFIVDDSGQVGVGTSGPTADLHISDGTATSLIESTNAANDSVLTFRSGAANWSVGQKGTSGEFIISSGGTLATNRVTVLTTGATGIGDSSPDHMLDVEGNIGIYADGYLNFGDTDGVTGYGIRDNSGTIEYKNAAGSWSSFGSVSVGDDSLDFDKFSDSMTLDASTNITASGTNELTITNTGTGRSFVVNDQAGDTTPFAITAGGNVGIGTDSPNFRLTTEGIGNGIAIHETGTSGNNNIFKMYKDSYTSGSQGFGVIMEGATADKASLVSFQDNGAVKSKLMNFDLTSGNIGVGDITPDHDFDVSGNIGMDAGGYLNFGDTDGSGGYGIRDNAGTIEFKNSAGSWTGLSGGSGDFLSNGSVPMTGQFQADYGSAAAPGITFDGDEDTGFWSTGADSVFFASGGTQKYQITGSAMRDATAAYGFYLTSNPSTSPSTPAYSFTGDTDTGMYLPAFDNIGFSIAGTETLRLNANSLITSEKIIFDASPADHTDAPIINYSGTTWMSLGKCLNADCSSLASGFLLNNSTQIATTTYDFGINDGGPDAALEISLDGSTASPAFMISSDDANDGDLVIVNGTGDLGVGDVTPDHKLDVEGNIGIYADGYLNFGDTDGVTGYGIRDNSGTIQVKNSSGSWADIATGSGGASVINDLTDAYSNATSNSLIMGHNGGSVGANDTFNTGVGILALDALNNTTGTANTALGYSALSANNAGDSNTGLGKSALAGNVSGSNNTAVGNNSLQSSTGDNNTAVGSSALTNLAGGQRNVAVGSSAGRNVTGDFNIAIGHNSLYNNTTGVRNVVIGDQAAGLASGNTQGDMDGNVVIGGRAGENMDGGASGAGANYNVIIGYQAAQNLDTGSSNIVIGNDINAISPTGDNMLNIGNIIYGRNVDGTGSTVSTGNVGIGNSNPDTRLEVNGSIKIGNGGETCTGGADGGMIRYVGGDLEYCDGSGWTALFAGSGGVSDLDGAYDGGSSVTVDSTDVIWNLSSTQDFRIQDAGTDSFIVTDGGRVGVGTSTPGSLLHVNGSMTDTSGAPKLNYFYGIADPSAASTATFYGSNGSMAKFGNSNLTNATLVGMTGVVEQGGVGALGTANGVESFVTKYGAGDIGIVNGFQTILQSSAAGTVANYNGLLVKTTMSSGTLTNAYGVKIEDLDATNGFGVYQEGANDTNYFAASVGIGDSSPDHTLDVAGNIGMDTGGYLNFGDTDGSGGYGIRDNAGTIEIKDSGGSWASVSGGGADDLGDHVMDQNLQTNGNWISNDGGNEGIFVQSDGKVSIGTSNSGDLLHLESNSPWFSIKDTDGGDEWSIGSTSGTFRFYNNTDGQSYLDFNQDGQATFAKKAYSAGDDTDDIGFEILNTESSTAHYPEFRITNYTGAVGGNGRMAFVRRRGDDSAPTALMSGDMIGEIHAAGAFQSNYSLHTGAMIQFIAEENWTPTNGGTRMKFYTTPTGSSTAQESLRLTGDGKLGIGTTAPNHLLDVEGNIGIDAGGYLNFGDTDGSGGYGIRDNAGTIQVKDSGGSWADIGTGSGGVTDLDGAYDGGSTVTVDSTDVIWNLSSSQDFRIQDNGSDAFVVTDSGRVGIGTGSPGTMLSIIGSNNGSGTNIYTRNDSSGTLATATVQVTNNSYQGTAMGITGSGYTPTWVGANEGFLYSAGTTGFSISASSTTGPLKFLTGHNTSPIERMRITSAGAVGVGTTSPVGMFHVNGTGDTQVTVGPTSGSGNAQISLWGRNSGTVNEARIWANYDGDLIMQPDTGRTYDFRDSAGDSAVVIDADGDVGLGTATPGVNFHVYNSNSAAQYIETGFASGNASLYLRVPGGSTSFVKSATDDKLTIDNGSLADFSFENASNSRLFINGTNGRVGIGTTSPNHLLDVEGNIGLNASAYLNFGDSDGSAGYGVRDNGGTIEYKNSGGSWTAFSGGGADDLGDHIMDQNLRANGNWISNDGGNEGIIIENNGDIMLGNGTTGSGGSDPVLVVNENDTRQAFMMFIDEGNDTSALGITSGDYFAMASENSQNGIQFKTNGTYASQYIDNATVAMTIDNSQNVGIQTTAPRQDLDVGDGTGDALIRTTANTGNVSLVQYYQENAGAYSGWATGTGTSGQFLINYDNAENTFNLNAMTILSDGKVGIGTDSPSNKLDVLSDGSTPLRLERADSGNTNRAALSLRRSNSGGVGAAGLGTAITFQAETSTEGVFEPLSQIFSTASDATTSAVDADLFFRVYSDSSAVDAMIVRSSGNVGIGTLVPTEKLHVNGNVQADAYFHNSDRRLKTNIQPMDGLDVILRLSGVRYNWKDEGDADIGLIAQEVEQVLPELVNTNPSTGFKAVKYSSLVSPLIESTKELYGICTENGDRIFKIEEKVEENSRRLASVEEKNGEQDKKVAKLENEVEQLKKQNEELKNSLEEIKRMLLEQKKGQ